MLFNKFETKEELYQFILDNAMAYTRMLKSYDIKFYNEIITQYIEPKNAGEAFWLYCNGHNETLKCECGTKLLFENVVNGYKSAECKPCYNKNRKINSYLVVTLRTQSDTAILCKNPNCKDPNTGKKRDAIKNKDGTWSEYCSQQCIGQGNSLLSRTEAKKTMMKNHGVENALQNKEIFDKMEENNIKKYGVANVMSKSTIASKVVETKIKIYGQPSSWSDKASYQEHVDVAAISFGYKPSEFTNVSQIPEVHNKKMKSAYLAKDYILPSNKIIRIQGYENIFLDIALKYYSEDVFNFDDSLRILYQFENKIHHYHPDFVIEQTKDIIEVKSDYTFYDDLDKNIAKALGSVISGYNQTFAIYREKGESSYITYDLNRNYIKDQLDNNDVTFTELDQFDNYIVDFYIETAKVAICYRSINFTNDIFHDKNYYFNMTEYFSNMGIQLIIVNDTEITDVWIKSLLSKFIRPVERVYARNTVVKEIQKNEIFDFLKNNHIQGFTATKIKYGLYYNNTLIAVMCFNTFRRGTGKDRGEGAFELVRYATSINVVGGASKLINHFNKLHNPTLIYSYSDNSISNGNMYEKLGFVLENNNKSDYKYNRFGEEKLHNRFGYRKGAQKEKLEIFDEDLSEKDNMIANSYRRIYDSGKKTWILNCNKEKE